MHTEEVVKEHRQCDVFSFSGAECCDLGLQFTDPMERTATVEDDVTSEKNSRIMKLHETIVLQN